MKTLLLFITLFAFMQSAFLPINLVLVVIIARGLSFDDRDNLILAFFGGLILAFLNQVNLGYYPLIFLLIIKFSGLIKKLPISFNPLMIFLSGSLLISLTAFLNSLFINQYLEIYPHLVEVILVLPAYFLIKLWEEKFIVKSYIKLKI